MARKLSVALVSLGCPKNEVDSEVILGLLKEAGYRIVGEVAQADVIIVNTCAFIEAAQDEAVQALLDLADLKQEGRCRALICAGCLGQRFGADLLIELPEVDAVMGPNDLSRVAEIVREALAGKHPVDVAGDAPMAPQPPRLAAGPPASRYVKIAEGCSHQCSFCIIPDLRGPFRSRPADAIMQECRQMVEAGTQEIVLVAQDTSAYGSDLDPPDSLARLLSGMRTLAFDGWIRALYLHPDRVDEQLLETIGGHMAVINYLDVPLQHVAPRILGDMRRAGSAEGYADLMAQIRRMIPDAALRTTFLIGYPGETEEEFAQLLDFIAEAQFDRATCFPFSAQDNTPAAAQPDQVPPELVAERIERLMTAQELISLERNRMFEGQRLRVLVERQDPDSGLWIGRSYRDAPEVDGQVLLRDEGRSQTVRAGTFVWAVIEEALTHDLRGRIV